jgi:Tol biopolymer transport system component
MKHALLLLLFATATISADSLSTAGDAQLWLPDVVSTANSEIRITFSPDGKRMLWGTIGWSGGVGGWDIFESVKTASGWSLPQAVQFNSTANDFDPSFAPDGAGVYFFSNRNGGLGKDDIYFAAFDARTGRYAAATNLGSQINSAGDEWAPVVSPDGSRLMFASDGRGGRGKHDLFMARRGAAGWGQVASLDALNGPDEDFDAAFLHDGRSIIFSSGDFDGTVRLYLAQFTNGKFAPRQLLPPSINPAAMVDWAFGPSISLHEPGVLYFTSHRGDSRGRNDIYRIRYRQ